MELQRQLKEQKAAEERLQKETERIQLEKEKQMKMLEEERRRKEEEQRLNGEEKKRSDEDERLKRMEEKQESQEIQSLAADSELKQESLQNDQYKPVNKQQQQQQPTVKHDEENRLHEQLKILQKKALKQKESEQNQKESKNISLTIDNRVTDNEPFSQKHEEKVTVAKESERQLHEEKQLKNEDQMRRQVVKVQEEQQRLDETKKSGKLQVHQNNNSKEKQVRRKGGKTEGRSGKKDEEKMKQKHTENEKMDKLLLLQKNEDTSQENLSKNKQLEVEKCNSLVQKSPKSTRSHAEHAVKLGQSTNHMEKIVKYVNNQSARHSEVRSEAGCSKVQAVKPDAATCQVNSSYKESSNVWEKTVEAKRLKWMHECESWRYIYQLHLSFVQCSCFE